MDYSFIEKSTTDFIRKRRLNETLELHTIKEFKYYEKDAQLAFFIENAGKNLKKQPSFFLLCVLVAKDNVQGLANTICFDTYVFRAENQTMEIVSIETHSGYKEKGIGSISLKVLKEIAYQNNCTKIFGNRIPIPNTDKNRKDLWNFYDKNGFTQWENKNYIEYDMANYKPK